MSLLYNHSVRKRIFVLKTNEEKSLRQKKQYYLRPPLVLKTFLTLSDTRLKSFIGLLTLG